jgi:malate dehydrogenase (oxaloacetate-decarboxylating)
MDYMTQSLKRHEQWRGKIEVVSRVPLETTADLSLAYTPGVAAPCLEIAENADLSYIYTCRANLVAVITDGTAVLGLGDIGAKPQCLLWRAKPHFLRPLAMWTQCLFA